MDPNMFKTEIDAIVTFFFVFLVTFVSFLIFMKRNKKKDHQQPQKKAKLPPGSLGWPFIGETLHLYSHNPTNFFSAKQRRYGEIFKTHILGCPCVMLASPEAAKFVLVSQAHLFKPTYPKSKEVLIGPSALFFHQGDYHARLRKLIQRSLSLDIIRNLVPHIDALASSALDSWATGQVINTFREMKKLSFEVGILAIFGQLEAHYKEELKKNYTIVDAGYNTFPTNIPGSPYKKALVARRRLRAILGDIISERKEKRSLEKDLLGCLLNSKGEEGEVLTDDQISDNILGVLFAAQDTTASVMTWIVKYLHEDPKLLEAVKAEQKVICEANEEGGQALSWAQTRNMSVSHKVTMESLRMATIISFVFREAVVDVEYKGYLIPKGWKVLPLFRNIHHNPKIFADPHKFDLSRFEVAPKPNTFMPFGKGVHSCPGNELAKLEILIMMHHLVTKLRWEVVGSQSGMQYSPFPVPVDGLPAKYWKESTC